MKFKFIELINDAKITMLFNTLFLTLFNSTIFGQEVPFPSALESSRIVQSPMAQEIPGSMILGNGDLNGILWIHEGNLQFSITKNDACDARLVTKNDPDLPTINIKEQTWNVPKGSHFPPSWSTPYPTPLICGVIRLNDDISKNTDHQNVYYSNLDIAKAVGIITLGSEKQNLKSSLKARVLADRNVITFETSQSVSLGSPGYRYTPSKTGHSFSQPARSSDTSKPRFIPEPKQGKQEDIKWVLTTIPRDEDWPGMTFAMAHATQGNQHAIAVVTSLENQDPVKAAVHLAKNTIREDLSEQIANHEKIWSQFWNKSGIQMGDQYLQSVWYRNLYFLRSFSKPGVPPVGLFMGCSTDVMPWHGVATTDYNFEQCFWPSFITNHVDLATPYNDLIVDYLPRGKWFAQTTYGFKGAHYPVNHFTHQINNPLDSKSKNKHMNFYFPYTYVIGANGWQAHNVWLAFTHNQDIEHLKTKAYPLVKEMAIFYTEFLDNCKIGADGKVLYGPTYSPEHRKFGEYNTPCDIAWTQFTLKAAIQGAQTLKCDEELVDNWLAALKQLPDYPIAPGSTPPVVSDVLAGEPIKYNVAVPALPVFPAGEVNWWSSEEQKKLFANTLEDISWTGYNSTMILAGARARLSMPGTHKWITDVFKERQMPSGFLQLLGDSRGNYSEQVAAAGIVSEMLMQSVGDIIRVFPAWPKEIDAQFSGLRAEGALLVSAKQTKGEVTLLKIESIYGGKIRLLSPWKKISVIRNGTQTTSLTEDRQGVVTLDSQKGDVFLFSKS